LDDIVSPQLYTIRRWMAQMASKIDRYIPDSAPSSADFDGVKDE